MVIAACHWKRNPPMLLTAVVGLAAFYGGHPLLSSPPRLRACVAHHMGDLPHDDEPVKTSQGVDVKVAAAEISRLLREQEAADAAAAAEIFVTDKDVVTSELEAALEATVKAAEEETGAAAAGSEGEEALDRAGGGACARGEAAGERESRGVRGDTNPPPPPPCCPRTGR